ncbi:hypothetical protein [Nocardia spumae]|uniref:hypothetical protein n=1 Tax=Nocardia spumae TaxID=2887190 RepID=UPI001D15285F|nr:hypothetical protein [Nocardia spumae]
MDDMTTIRPARRGIGRRVGTALTGGVLGAATICALAVPQTAAAAVTQVGAMPDMSFGLATNYGDACSYTLQANVTDPVAPVTFYDNGAPIGVARPGGAYALIGWVPATSGPHTLTAVQAGQPAQMPAATLNLPVGTGLPLGYACLVIGG